MQTKDNVIRRCRFAPYLKGCGPTFQLTVWDTYRTDRLHKSILGYRLTMIPPHGRKPIELFTGEDFDCSPCYAIDSDDCVAALMGFLTLRPGDTDRDYFDNYTEAQLDFTAQHAEALACEVYSRFGQV